MRASEQTERTKGVGDSQEHNLWVVRWGHVSIDQHHLRPASHSPSDVIMAIEGLPAQRDKELSRANGAAVRRDANGHPARRRGAADHRRVKREDKLGDGELSVVGR